MPWAALASCWPLPQQLLPVSAAGGGRRGKTVTMLVEQTHEPETPVTETAKLTADDAQLFDALKELRLELAKKAEIPAFVVFSNATLADMAKKKPFPVYGIL